MNSVLWFLIVFAAVGIGVWLASFVVEAIRPKPKAPAKLRWAPDIPIDTIEVGGHKLRYIKVGKGPALVLLHTLRTQLDLFEKVIPELSKHFTVYALDYPGHGYSDIPTARYDAAFFTEAVEGFLAKLDLRDVTLAGVSIGGSIVLIIAAFAASAVEMARAAALAAGVADVSGDVDQVDAFDGQAGRALDVGSGGVVTHQAVDVFLNAEIKIGAVPSVTGVAAGAAFPIGLDPDAEVVELVLLADGDRLVAAGKLIGLALPGPVDRPHHLLGS